MRTGVLGHLSEIIFYGADFKDIGSVNDHGWEMSGIRQQKIDTLIIYYRQYLKRSMKLKALRPGNADIGQPVRCYGPWHNENDDVLVELGQDMHEPVGRKAADLPIEKLGDFRLVYAGDRG